MPMSVAVCLFLDTIDMLATPVTVESTELVTPIVNAPSLTPVTEPFGTSGIIGRVGGRLVRSSC